MKIGLIFAKIEHLYLAESIRNEHIGLGYLAYALQNNGFEYEIIDGHYFGYGAEKMVELIIEGNFDVIGFSILYSNFEESSRIINNIKNLNPLIKVFLGGQHVSFCAKEILQQNKNIWCIIRGEGEFVLIDLLNSLQKNLSLKDIKSITYIENGKIIENNYRRPETNIERYGKINRDVLDKGLENNCKSSLNVMAGRGCTYNCSFCTGNKIFNPFQDCSWRVQKAKNVVADLNYLFNKYGDNDNLFEIVNFCDLNFINETRDGLQWLDDFVTEVRKSNIDFFFNIMTRVDSVVHQKERVFRLRDIGLIQIEMGLEAGADKGLAVYNKKITLNQSVLAVAFLREQRIDFGVSGFIMYHPYTTIGELRINAEFLKNISYWKIMFLFTKMALYPGSDITDKIKQEGLLYDSFCHYEVYDYRFADEKVEILYNNILNKVAYDLLNNISNTIVYLELQLTLVYRKLERINIYPKKDLDKNVNSIEEKLRYEIDISKNLIYDFFCSALDLVEIDWNCKKFNLLVNVFTQKYIKQNEIIIKCYDNYANEIMRLL